MRKVEKKIIINQERCKGCQICTTVCPQKILNMSQNINHKGYHPVDVTEQEQCTSCGLCAMVCPDLVIKVFK